jgi:hypothetical protein
MHAHSIHLKQNFTDLESDFNFEWEEGDEDYLDSDWDEEDDLLWDDWLEDFAVCFVVG